MLQSQEFVLPRINQAGRNPLHPLLNHADKRGVVSKPSRKENRVQGLSERDGLSADLLGLR